jgi:hypothetical protein
VCLPRDYIFVKGPIGKLPQVKAPDEKSVLHRVAKTVNILDDDTEDGVLGGLDM